MFATCEATEGRYSELWVEQSRLDMFVSSTWEVSPELDTVLLPPQGIAGQLSLLLCDSISSSVCWVSKHLIFKVVKIKGVVGKHLGPIVSFNKLVLRKYLLNKQVFVYPGRFFGSLESGALKLEFNLLIKE